MNFKNKFIEILENEVLRWRKAENEGLRDNNLVTIYESELLIEVIEYKYNNFTAIYLLDNLCDILENIYYNINTEKYILTEYQNIYY